MQRFVPLPEAPQRPVRDARPREVTVRDTAGRGRERRRSDAQRCAVTPRRGGPHRCPGKRRSSSTAPRNPLLEGRAAGQGGVASGWGSGRVRVEGRAGFVPRVRQGRGWDPGTVRAAGRASASQRSVESLRSLKPLRGAAASLAGAVGGPRSDVPLSIGRGRRRACRRPPALSSQWVTQRPGAGARL